MGLPFVEDAGLSGFADLANRLSGLASKEGALTLSVLEEIGSGIEAEAKEEIGHYQRSDVGPFAAWAELAPSTKKDRVRGGFPENEPLLRTGELRDSIGHKVTGDGVAVGSDSEIAVYQEMGTETIPPRPFLRVAAWRMRREIGKIYGRAFAKALKG